LAALKGKADGLRKMLTSGLDPTTISPHTQSHGTALHHAVWSGSIDAVRALVEAGADLTRRDTIYGGTPLDWAEHALGEEKDGSNAKRYAEIARFLRQAGADP